MRGAPLSLFLAARELRHDWRASLCFIAALIGVLAPLLIILALKNGIIVSMVGRLIEDPNNREVIVVGAGRFDATFFNTVGARDDVAFIIPATRSINTSADVIRNKAARKVERSVPLIPTGAGDPLLDGMEVPRGAVVVTAALAEELDVQAGAPLEMLIGRTVDGQSQTARADLQVMAVLEPQVFGRAAAFVNLDDLVAVERFRDDTDITTDNWFEQQTQPDVFASFRLYAADLDSLASLTRALADMSVEVRARAENATLLLGFRNNLNILYAAVAALAIVGFWAAMAANLRGLVERQRVTFSLLDLLALPLVSRCLIPIWQSLILVGLGMLATFILVVPAVVAINAFFATPGGAFVAMLGWRDVLGTGLVGLVTALSASVWALFAVREILPQEVLRHA